MTEILSPQVLSEFFNYRCWDLQLKAEFNFEMSMLHADVVIDHDPLNDSLKPGPSLGVLDV